MTKSEDQQEPELVIVPVKTDADIATVAKLAEEIWNQHFTPLLGKMQVDYMINKFQSAPSLTEQLNKGYEYFKLLCSNNLAGYCGVHDEDGSLFLSKLYIHKDFRGKHISTSAFKYLISLCKERNLVKIWLTCNKYNANTLAVYKHLGFNITKEQVTDIGNGYVMDDFVLEFTI